MELIAGDVEASHCGFADLDALLVATRVKRALDLQKPRPAAKGRWDGAAGPGRWVAPRWPWGL